MRIEAKGETDERGDETEFELERDEGETGIEEGIASVGVEVEVDEFAVAVAKRERTVEAIDLSSQANKYCWTIVAGSRSSSETYAVPSIAWVS